MSEWSDREYRAWRERCQGTHIHFRVDDGWMNVHGPHGPDSLIHNDEGHDARAIWPDDLRFLVSGGRFVPAPKVALTQREEEAQ